MKPQVTMDKGHNIVFVQDGELAYCKRCHGGEVELEVSCADRLAKQVEELETENEQLHYDIKAMMERKEID